MSKQKGARALDEVAQKWRALAERRRGHFIDLLRSGRWKHYYTEQQFLARMREATKLSERWATIAPPPPLGELPVLLIAHDAPPAAQPVAGPVDEVVELSAA